MGRVLAVGAAVLAIGGFTAGNAGASSWKVTGLSAGQVDAALYGVSCPTTQLCVAVGGNNTLASSTNPTGGPSAWSVGHPGGGIDLPGGSVYGGAQIRGVSCPSNELCVAVSFQGKLYSSTAPAGGPAAWKVIDQAVSGPNVHMTGISCPTTSLCVAGAYGGKLLFSTDPTGPSQAWTVTELPQLVDFRAISCASPLLCVATGNEGRIFASTNPTGGPSAWESAGAPAGEFGLDGISCPSLSLCVTATSGQILTSTAPTGGAATWQPVTAGTGLPVTGVSCPSPVACAAVDNNADVLVSTNPTGGAAAWSYENVVPFGSTKGNGMFGISCPTTGLCAGVGQRFQVITSTDPFAGRTSSPAGARRLRGPHVVITGYPPKRLDPRKGGVKVGFRFRGVGTVAGFECKLERRRFRACKSPRRYRVGKGKHVFKVRAVAFGGRRSRPATFHFRVGRLIERSTPGTCKPGAESNIGKPCL
jgi:hypothetical protein